MYHFILGNPKNPTFLRFLTNPFVFVQHSIDYWLWADLIAPESERVLKSVVRVHRKEDALLFVLRYTYESLNSTFFFVFDHNPPNCRMHIFLM